MMGSCGHIVIDSDTSVVSFSDATIHSPFKDSFPGVRNLADAEWISRVYPETFAQDDIWINNLGCFVIDTRNFRILVDAGVGPRSVSALEDTAGRLDTLFGLCGLTWEDIDCVVFTHLHPDHTGWAFDPISQEPRFPRARFYLHQLDYEYFVETQTPQQPNIATSIAPLFDHGVCDIIHGDTFELAPGVVARHSPGHTPGHLSIEVLAGTRPAIISGDVLHHPFQLMHPEISHRVDVDKRISGMSRKKLLRRIDDLDALLLAGHFLAPSIGQLVIRSERTQWSPTGEKRDGNEPS